MALPREETGCVVIGAGVIGLAVARRLARAGQAVVVLEAEAHIGEHLSSRNSEVIHGGLYYPPGSLKADTCLRGKALLYEYCAARGIAHRRCGKWVVAGPGQAGALENLHANARAAGAEGLSLVSRERLRREAPWLRAEQALESATSGIVDSHGLMASLAAEAQTHGAVIALRHRVAHIGCRPGSFTLTVEGPDQPFRLRAERLINAAGLGAVPLTELMDGLPKKHRPEQRFAKGHYFKLHGKPPAERLIYPLPDADGLGVHLTLDLAGGARGMGGTTRLPRGRKPPGKLRAGGTPLLAGAAAGRAATGLRRRAPQAVAERHALSGLSDPGPGRARYRRAGEPARH